MNQNPLTRNSPDARVAWTRLRAGDAASPRPALQPAPQDPETGREGTASFERPGSVATGDPRVGGLILGHTAQRAPWSPTPRPASPPEEAASAQEWLDRRARATRADSGRGVSVTGRELLAAIAAVIVALAVVLALALTR